LKPFDPAVADWPGAGRIIIAFSGGADSLSLLAGLSVQALNRPLLAVHIDHGLDADSTRRADQAEALAQHLGVNFECHALHLEAKGNLEARARQARYAALASVMQPEEVVVTAHHANDVAETLLLRLLRGSGIEGLAGIEPCQRFGVGWLLRPMLRHTRSECMAYLAERQLKWVDDPSNASLDLDRNHLRQAILPALQQRFPGATEALNRSAWLNREAAAALVELAHQDLKMVRIDDHCLCLKRLRTLSRFRQAQVIRHWVMAQQHPLPAGKPLAEFVRQLNESPADRHPELRLNQTTLKVKAHRVWMQ
jgi:tRNA(Ile)-lysidine synthase